MPYSAVEASSATPEFQMTAPTPHTATSRPSALPNLPEDIETPAYVLDVALLKRNLATAERIKRETGIKMLLATKAWAMPAVFPLMRDTLDGTTASGLYEALLQSGDFPCDGFSLGPGRRSGNLGGLAFGFQPLDLGGIGRRGFFRYGLEKQKKGGEGRHLRGSLVACRLTLNHGDMAFLQESRRRDRAVRPA